MESEKILRALANKNRHRYKLQLIEQQISVEEQSTTFITRYEPSLGLMQLSDSNGNSFYSSAITNGATGTGEAVRVRGKSGIPAYDSMPRTQTNPTPAQPNKEFIIVGLLCSIPVGLVLPSTDKYTSSNNIKNSGTINPLGFFIGVLNGNTITQTKLITNIPSFTISDSYSNFKLAPFLYDTYYSMGYNANILTYLANITLPVFQADTAYVNYAYDIASIDIPVLLFNIQQQSVSTSTITFRSQALISMGYPNPNQKIPQVYVSQDDFYIRVLKYKSTTDNSINYVLIGGTSGINPQGIGLIIWDIGQISNLQSRTNLASCLGFGWYANPTKQSELGFRVVDSYGSVGGIVVKVDFGFSGFNEIFIPETFLKGESATNISSGSVLFSSAVDLVNYPSLSNLEVNVGSMPKPLETRNFISPYKIPKYQDSNNRQTNLILYSLFSKERGKQVFS